MTKAISSYPDSQRKEVVIRRLRRVSGGLGYWAASDAAKKIGQVEQEEQEQE